MARGGRRLGGVLSSWRTLGGGTRSIGMSGIRSRRSSCALTLSRGGRSRGAGSCGYRGRSTGIGWVRVIRSPRRS